MEYISVGTLCSVFVIILSVALFKILVNGKRNQPINEIVYDEKKEKEEKTRIWLIITSIFFGAISLVCTYPVLIASAMTSAFATVGVDLLIFSVLSFPVFSLISIILSWFFYKSKRLNIARNISLLPLVSGLLVILAWFVIYLGLRGPELTSDNPTFSVQGSVRNVSECALPVLDGGDDLVTTGCGSLEVGVVGGGTTSSISEAHNWQFTAQQGKRVKFLLLPIDSNKCTTVKMKFLDTRGEIIKSVYISIPSCGYGIRFYYFDPPTNGIYILRIETPEKPGEYWIELER